MNPRTSLVTAALTLSLIVPAAAGASHMNIPADPVSSKPAGSQQHIVKLSSSATTLGLYNAQAYVHGGSSLKVAKAIMAAGKTKTLAMGACPNNARYHVPC